MYVKGCDAIEMWKAPAQRATLDQLLVPCVAVPSAD